MCAGVENDLGLAALYQRHFGGFAGVDAHLHFAATAHIVARPEGILPGVVAGAGQALACPALPHQRILQLRLPRAVAAIFIGTALAASGAAYQALFANPRNYYVCLLRLVVMPVVLILIFAVTGASHWIENGEMLLMVLILAASSPVATMIAMLTQKFGGGDGVYASHLASLSSVLCIVTMPLMALLAQALL